MGRDNKFERLRLLDAEKSFYASPYRSVKSKSYFPVYDHLFSPLKGTPLSFMEIGVLGGGSLFMWRQFFGPEARIIGVDLNPDAKKWEEHGFEIFIGDQADPEFWSELRKTVGTLDVILDDGGHTYLQQLSTLEFGQGLIGERGTIVIEDTFTSYQAGFGPKQFSFMEAVRRKADQINGRSERVARKQETRIWRMEIFESMVAFHFSPFAQIEGHVIDNGRLHTPTLDYRYNKNYLVSRLDVLAYRLAWLDKVPGLQWAYKKFRQGVLLLTGYHLREREKLRRFFRK